MSADAAGAGWHPDPTGRFEQRWWDGERWTEAVSTAGIAQADPYGGEPPDPDRAVLERPGLAVDFTQTGMEGGGTWRVLERDGTAQIGWVQVDRGGLTSQPTFVVQDLGGRTVLVAHLLGGLQPDLAVKDHLGTPVGQVRTRGNELTFLAAGPAGSTPGTLGAWGSARITNMDTGAPGGALFTIGTPDPRPPHAQILSNAQQPVGLVEVHEDRPSLFDRDVGTSWFVLDRDPQMPEPLASLVVAGIPAICLATSHARAARRRRARNRRS